MTSGSLCDVMVSIMTRNARDMGLRHNISHFHHTHDNTIGLIVYLLFSVLATSKVISGWVPISDSMMT